MANDPKQPGKLERPFSPFEDKNPELNTVEFDADSTSEWEKLKRIAHASYPEKLISSKQDGLNPKQRLVAFAHVLNWTNAKIAKESGLKVDTVGKWLRDVRIINFADAIRYNRGEKDIKDFYRANLFKAARLLVDTMDNEAIAIQLRFKAALEIMEMGKDKEKGNGNGDAPSSATLKSVLASMQKGSTIQVQEKESENVDERSTDKVTSN